MSEFILDPRLEQDSFRICDLPCSQLRLMNNQDFPWLILIPRLHSISAIREFFELSESLQQGVLKEISEVSRVLKSKTQCHKINVAWLGNQVSQVHIHIIARDPTDKAWPGAVFGRPAEPYPKETIDAIIHSYQAFFRFFTFFTGSPHMTDYFHSAKTVIEIEQAAISRLILSVSDSFNLACELMSKCEGKIVVLGMGKSGHIGNKIAATLASTGTPAFAVNAGEASHGDFGMIGKKDLVLAISNSGSTPEILSLLPLFKRLNIPVISMTGNKASPLALASQVHLWISIEKEACPLNLAPTASTTAALVLGDAIAVALLTGRGFTREDFALSHPGGALGKRLLLTVGDLMYQGDKIPKISLGASLHDALMEMTRKTLGMTTIVDEQNRLAGVFTDGDLRRFFESGKPLKDTQIQEIMTRTPKTVSSNLLAFDALELMERLKITVLVVVNPDQHVAGVLHLHTVLTSGII